MRKININIVPTPKPWSSAGKASVPASKRTDKRMFDVTPLTPSEIEDFLAFWNTGNETMDMVLAALSPKTQAMLWLAHYRGVLNDAAVATLVGASRDDLLLGGWDETEGGMEATEKLLQSTLLVADAINDSCPMNNMDRKEWGYFVRQAVIGCGDRGHGVVSSPPVFTSFEQIGPVAGVAAYITGVRQYTTEGANNRRIDTARYKDAEGRNFIGSAITNPAIAAYVAEHPESGYQLGKFAAERDLGESEEDAQSALDFIASTADAKPVREGWL